MAKDNTTASDFIFEEADEEAIKKFDMDAHLVGLLLHEPFFSTFIRNMSKIRTQSIPTAGVMVKDMNLSLYWNPRFLASLRPDEVRELLKHECYHIIFNHCTSRKQDPHMMWNIATDLAINSILKEDSLPEGGLIPGKPLKPSISKDPKQAARWKKLSDFISKLPKGMASEWYMEKLKNDEEIKKVCEEIQEEMEAGSGQSVTLDDHGGWGDLTDEEKQIMEGKVKKILKDAVNRADSSNGWGTVSSSVREQLRKLCEKSIDWKKILQSFVGRRQRMNKARTHKKINRKYPYIHPGVKRDHTSSLAVYIDQSGSVGDEDIVRFFGALSELSKKVSFTVYPFDWVVDEDSSFVWRKGKKVIPKRTLSGGTSFEAVEDHFRTVGNKFDGYIVLTDGGAAKPPPSKKKRCWVLLPNCEFPFHVDKVDLVVKMDITKRVK